MRTPDHACSPDASVHSSPRRPRARAPLGPVAPRRQRDRCEADVECPCGHTEDLLTRRVSEIDSEISGLQETKADLLAFTERFNAIECPEGAEPWPCAKEFIAVAAETGRR